MISRLLLDGRFVAPRILLLGAIDSRSQHD